MKKSIKNVWMLTEERPKPEVVCQILKKICRDKNLKFDLNKISLEPMFKENLFKFVYTVKGFQIENYENIFLKIVSGKSSFVDFLIYFSENEPNIRDKPEYAIEETKTSDKDSRNTSVYQRGSKFVYLDFYYPDCKKIMLYNEQAKNDSLPTKTNIFGTRMLLTIGVEIMGKKNLDPKIFCPFKEIEEFIQFKKEMSPAPSGNIPIELEKFEDEIKVSGRLEKSGTLSHDPNIGALSTISKTLRCLNWKKDIIITKHGLSQSTIQKRKNKFIIIANQLNIKLESLKLPTASLPEDYWYYDFTSEKNATILLHILMISSEGVSVKYENHAGCERGYLFDENNKQIIISKSVPLPDIIICDTNDKKLYNYEGKIYSKKEFGIKQIGNFDAIEREYLNEYYPDYQIMRGLVLYDKDNKVIAGLDHQLTNGLVFYSDKEYSGDHKTMFLLNREGKIILNKNTPNVIKDAVKKYLK